MAGSEMHCARESAMAKSTARKARSGSVRKSAAKKSSARKSSARKSSARKSSAKKRRSARSRSGPRSNRSVRVRLSKAVLANVGAVQTLADFLATVGTTTLEQRKVIVDQARIMIDQTYVHLPLKRAM